MRRIIVTEFISLDGVAEAPGGEDSYPHTGWTFDIDFIPEVYESKDAELEEAPAMIIGTKTYESFAGAWPQREIDGGEEAEFAKKFNSMKKYLVSSTITEPEWNNTERLEGDPIEAIRALRDSEGSPIMVQGSIRLVQELIKADLVDTFHFLVWPVILGSGRRVFPDDAADKCKLTLREAKRYDNGVQLMKYDRVR
jgi:dihydrofolate reductase